jgi:hypothetical protein
MRDIERRIERGIAIGRIYCNDPEKSKKAGERVKTAYEIIKEKVEKEAVILE